MKKKISTSIKINEEYWDTFKIVSILLKKDISTMLEEAVVEKCKSVLNHPEQLNEMVKSKIFNMISDFEGGREIKNE